MLAVAAIGAATAMLAWLPPADLAAETAPLSRDDRGEAEEACEAMVSDAVAM